jgi:hypothetical protein
MDFRTVASNSVKNWHYCLICWHYWHYCLISDFKGNAFVFSPCSLMLAVGLYIASTMFKYFPSIPSVLGLLSWVKGFFFLQSGVWTQDLHLLGRYSIPWAPTLLFKCFFFFCIHNFVFKIFLLFIYSHVCTLFGSFLPPAHLPHLLPQHPPHFQALFCFKYFSDRVSYVQGWNQTLILLPMASHKAEITGIWHHFQPIDYGDEGIYLFRFIYLLLCWGYIVTFTKVLIIYHSWIYPFHHSPLFPLPHSWNSFNRFHFSVYIHVYTILTPYSASYTLSPHPHPNW